MRMILSCLGAALIATAATGELAEVGFADLPDPAAADFDDPFRAMGPDNLTQLKTVVQLRARLAGEEVAAEARPRLEARVAAAAATLAAEGHDIEALIGRRWEVAEKRRNAKLAVNPALEGQQVALSGYLIPAPAEADGTPAGYLVSAVGLCSHFPPPPPNQLVRVRLTDAEMPERSTLYTPVRFAGTLRSVARDETIFVLDGEVRMVSMWTLDADDAVPLGPAVAMATGPDAWDPLAASSRPDRLGGAEGRGDAVDR